MRPLLHATLINGRYGDPAVYIETLFERRAILFDLGELANLPPRKILRVEQVFVSHAHVDHFIGFDRLLRLLVGRQARVSLYGPEGFVDHVRHKLHAYRWNLAEQFVHDLVFVVTELDGSLVARTVQYRLKSGFTEEVLDGGPTVDGVLHEESTFRVRAAMLEHRTPCLAFAIEETAHVNVWKTRLAELGLPVGPWLRDLKRAVIEGWPDDHPVRLSAKPASGLHEMPLSALRSVVTVTPGQKIAYVTDVADTAANRAAIVRLVQGADLLFIEAVFARADASLAAQRAHLTTLAAGNIARTACVRRLEPFHFSPRYSAEEERMLSEVRAAFEGNAGDAAT